MLSQGRNAEDGVTLVELLVVMLLLGIIGGFATVSMVQGMRKQDEIVDRIDVLAELQKAGARVTRELRGACTSLTLNGVSFTPTLEPYRTVVALPRAGEYWRYSFDLPAGSETLTVDIDRWDPTLATPAWVDSSVQDVTWGLDNRTAGTPLFSYLDGDGNPTTVINDLDRVELSLRAPANGDPVIVETIVNLRNGGRPCPAA